MKPIKKDKIIAALLFLLMFYVIVVNIERALSLNIVSIIGIIACSIVIYGLWGVIYKKEIN